MARRREINVFSLSFLDLISGALGAVIILYVAVPKANPHKQEIEKITESVRAKDAQMQKLQAELEQLKEQQNVAQQLVEENEELKARLAAIPEPSPEPPPEEAEGKGLEVGFKFKGKNVLFILDTSLSMTYVDGAPDDKPYLDTKGHGNRMGQVMAGFKMLITSMPPSFNVDILQFPDGERTPFKPLFGGLKPLGKGAKYDIIDYLYAIRPKGGTPTRDVLRYAFENYKGATDIVLLTDGEPSLHNSNVKDNVYEILADVRRWNPGAKVQISTIGVGQEVLHDKTAKPYQFLRMLADENGGFFVGF